MKTREELENVSPMEDKRYEHPPRKHKENREQEERRRGEERLLPTHITDRGRRRCRRVQVIEGRMTENQRRALAREPGRAFIRRRRRIGERIGAELSTRRRFVETSLRGGEVHSVAVLALRQTTLTQSQSQRVGRGGVR